MEVGTACVLAVKVVISGCILTPDGADLSYLLPGNGRREATEEEMTCDLAMEAAISGCDLTGRLVLEREAAVIVVGDIFMAREVVVE